MPYHGWGAVTPYGAPVSRLRRELDRLFEDFGGSGGGSSWTPSVDVCEMENEIRIDFEVPGIKPEDVDITVENATLSVSGERRPERKEGQEARYHMAERTHGSFFRSFTLPQGIDEEKITADFSDGVLHVRIPKDALPQPRHIQIEQRGSGGSPKEIAARGEESRGVGRSERPDTSRGRGKASGEHKRGEDTDEEPRRERLVARGRSQE